MTESNFQLGVDKLISNTPARAGNPLFCCRYSEQIILIRYLSCRISEERRMKCFQNIAAAVTSETAGIRTRTGRFLL